MGLRRSLCVALIATAGPRALLKNLAVTHPDVENARIGDEVYPFVNPV